MGFIVSALGGIFATLFGLIANILTTLTGFVLSVSVSIFNYVSSGNFITLSYTSLAGNPFLQVGWTLTRDLTNIIFIVVLVVIGLGTALRLQNFDARKTLPTLIIIALLINFTPVILGVLVDAANIIMNFFIQEGFASGNYFINASFGQWHNISALAGGLKFWDPMASNEAIAAAVGSIALMNFNLLAALIFLLFAFLFIIRYVAIWLLVILSPFAFAAYILPATRGYWNDWWKQFARWVFLGVVAAFFLYLGDQFLSAISDPEFIRESLDEINGTPGLSSIVNALLPYTIALIFLFMGLAASVSFAPTGADKIMKSGQKAITKAGTIAKDWQLKIAKSTAKNIATAPVRTWNNLGAAAGSARIRFKEARKPVPVTRYRTDGTISKSLEPKESILKSAIGAGMGVTKEKIVDAAKQTQKDWGVPLPKEAYDKARELGLPKGQSIMVALKRWHETPVDNKLSAAGKGLWGAMKGVKEAGWPSKKSKDKQFEDAYKQFGKALGIEEKGGEEKGGEKKETK